MGKYPNTVKSFLLHYTDKINTFVQFHESYSTRQSTNYKRDKTKYHFTSKFTRKAPSRVRDRGGVVSQWENCIREINIPEHLVLSPIDRTFPKDKPSYRDMDTHTNRATVLVVFLQSTRAKLAVCSEIWYLLMWLYFDHTQLSILNNKLSHEDTKS